MRWRGDPILVTKLLFCNEFRCNLSQWGDLENPSGLVQDVVSDHVIETMVPRFVSVTANVYTVGKFDFTGLHVLDVEIYVED